MIHDKAVPSALRRLGWMLFLVASPIMAADIAVSDGWALRTRSGQIASSAYLTLTPQIATSLCGASTTQAARVEIHRYRTLADGRRVMERLDQVSLRPRETLRMHHHTDSVHFMLIGLSQPLQVGTQVPFKLKFCTAGKPSWQEVMLEVRNP